MVKVCMVNEKIIGFKQPIIKSSFDKLKTIPSFQYNNLYKIYCMHILHYPLLKKRYNIKIDFVEKMFRDMYIKDEIVSDIKIKESKLLDYQMIGINKLINNKRFILADDTGLGKSVQGLAAIQYLDCKKTLVVTLSSLKHQWKEECDKFIYKESVVINGLPKQREIQWKTDVDIYICNYETLLKDKIPFNIKFDVIILDEASQRIKNPNSKVNGFINKLRSDIRWILTATPIENSLTDLYSLLKFIEPDMFTNYYRFLDLYTIRKELFIRGNRFKQIVGFKNTEELRDTIIPIMLKRDKKDVLKDLPPITEQKRYVEMSKEQKKQYDSIVSLLLQSKNENQKRSILMAQISLLKSCIGSTQILRQSESGYTDHIYFPEKDYSAKLDELDNIIPMLKGQTIIFSESVRMCKLVSKKIDGMNIKNIMVTGEDNADVKDIKTKKFKDGLFDILVSSNAIAYGKNIQCAQNVINMDLPWNPAVLKNRISRVYRMLQKNHVLVINILTESTIENKILNKLKMKVDLFDKTIPDKIDVNFILDNI